MRTTLPLESDAFATAQACALARSATPGPVVSDLLRLGSAGRRPMRQQDGAWFFELPADTPKLSTARVKNLLDEVS